jgi:hypothetical protein
MRLLFIPGFTQNPKQMQSIGAYRHNMHPKVPAGDISAPQWVNAPIKAVLMGDVAFPVPQIQLEAPAASPFLLLLSP